MMKKNSLFMLIGAGAPAWAVELYKNDLIGDRTISGTLEWGVDLSSDGSFQRINSFRNGGCSSDFTAFSLTIEGLTYTEVDDQTVVIPGHSDAEYEVVGGKLDKVNAIFLKSLGNDDAAFILGPQITGDGGLSSY